MGVVILVLLMLAGPIAVISWSVRVLRRWEGRWRLTVLAPVGVLGAGLTVVALGMRHDPMGHSGWLIWWLLSVIAAALTCYGLYEVHGYHHRARSKSENDERARRSSPAG